MNKKGQGAIYTFIFVLVVGIFLFAASPSINQARIDTLAIGGHGIWLQFLLMMLMPLIWGAYIVFSLILVRSKMFSLEG